MFRSFDFAWFATDITFHQSTRPAGKVSEGKAYFSGNHKLYRYRVEVFVLPSGLAVGCRAHYSGPAADLEMFGENKAFYEEESKKVTGDLEYENDGVLQQ